MTYRLNSTKSNRLKSYLKKIDLTTTELQKYYNLDEKLIRHINKAREGRELIFSDEEKETIKNIVDKREFDKKIPVTKRLKDKLERIVFLNNSLTNVAKLLNTNINLLSNIIQENTKNINIDLNTKILNLYKKREKEYQALDKDYLKRKEVNIYKLIKDEKIKVIEENKSHYKPPKIHLKYKIYRRDNYFNKTTRELLAIGEITKEYPRFFLVQCKNYRETILKNYLYTKNIEFFEVKG